MLTPPTPPRDTIFHILVDVRPSPIHGFGLFAAERAPRGTPVLTWGGKIFTTEDIEQGHCEPHTAIRLTSNEWIGSARGESRQPDDFMNHSCTPNVGLRGYIDLVAINDISKDEELTADYSTWLDDPIYQKPCLCGSVNTRCRRVISGVAWRNSAFAREKFAYLSPYLRELVVKNSILR